MSCNEKGPNVFCVSFFGGEFLGCSSGLRRDQKSKQNFFCMQLRHANNKKCNNATTTCLLLGLGLGLVCHYSILSISLSLLQSTAVSIHRDDSCPPDTLTRGRRVCGCKRSSGSSRVAVTRSELQCNGV